VRVSRINTKITYSKSSGESVSLVDRGNVTSCIHGSQFESKAVSTSNLYGRKTDAKNEYFDKTYKKSHEMRWVRLGISCLSKFDREEIDGDNKLNDQHIYHVQAIIKS